MPGPVLPGHEPKTKLLSPLVVPCWVGQQWIGSGAGCRPGGCGAGSGGRRSRRCRPGCCWCSGGDAVAGDVERVGRRWPRTEGVLEGVGRVDLADRVAQVLGVGGAVLGEVAGGVERDPAVQADDHEGEQRLVELAARVAAGRVAQVEPDRVGDAVAVVVDVVGDLAGGRVGDQVGEGRRVVAVGRDRAEDPRPSEIGNRAYRSGTGSRRRSRPSRWRCCGVR